MISLAILFTCHSMRAHGGVIRSATPSAILAADIGLAMIRRLGSPGLKHCSVTPVAL